ncbi:energy transducer TonB [Thauera phenolivorans]|uniref:energy transducer TonB n=1 Tax=Thauera phenolivorans TaxID=1792543 RepID=UPI001E489DE0|nr:energy transducer TonB [Thauera phenolivorans]
MGRSLSSLPERTLPRPGSRAARRYAPVQWGLFLAVAGAHAAGIGLLAGGGNPQPARPAERPIVARLIVPSATNAARGIEPTAAAAPPASSASPVAKPSPAAARAAPAPRIRTAPRPARATLPAPEKRPAKPPSAPAPSSTAAAKSARTMPPAGAPASQAARAPSVPPVAAPAKTDSPITSTLPLARSAPAAASAAGPAAEAGHGANDGKAGGSTPARYDADYLHNPAPAYPAASRRLNEQGTVLLRVRVGRDGRAREIEMLEGSGSPRLDRAASEAVRRWRFVPASEDGAAVDSWLRVPIAFRLER